MAAPPDHGARGRLRQWQAGRRWIPNRHDNPLYPAERMAETGGDFLLEAARATGNWSVVNILAALAEEARQRHLAGMEKRRAG